MPVCGHGPEYGRIRGNESEHRRPFEARSVYTFVKNKSSEAELELTAKLPSDIVDEAFIVEREQIVPHICWAEVTRCIEYSQPEARLRFLPRSSLLFNLRALEVSAYACW